jgi:ketosteroid isomerase-like protein
MAHHPRPTNALEALDAHLALVARDLEPWLALFADDAVIEFPYAAGMGVPARLQGKDAIRSYFARATQVFQNFSFRDVRRHATPDPNLAIAEAHGSATIATTSRPYEQDYVFFVECRDGLIVRYREYWNPVAAHESFGGVDRVSDAMGAH